MDGNEAGRVDLAALEPLAVRAAGGDDAAWKELVTALWPVLRRVVARAASMSALSASDDHVTNVVTSVLDKLGRKGSHGLKLYIPWRARNEGKSFADWIYIVTANTARDYLRTQAGDATSYNVEISAKRLLNEFTSSPAMEDIIQRLGHRPPFTAQQTARQILDFAEKHLGPEQHRALTLWLDGGAFEEIASDLSLDDADAARRVVRAAVAILRRAFGTEG
jgi:DNA-directed RNA polymerase specialized sigma24 family protein